VLFISGYPEGALLAEQVIEKGVMFLEKPISPDTLLPKVRELLDLT
jgi:hypothetical protein